MNVIKHRLVAVVAMALSCAAIAGPEETKATAAALDKPYVTVNGNPQSTAWAELVFREIRMRGVPDSEQLRQEVREILINQALMEEDAKRAGLDKDPLIKSQMELAKRDVLVRVWQQNLLSRFNPTDAQIRTEYEAQVQRLGDKEFLVRHLLVADASTAKLLIEKINAGAKLESLSAEYSIDATTKDKGGLTDWADALSLLPPILEAVQPMSKGAVLKQPVRTNLGWHILQLVDTRPVKVPSFEEAKPRVMSILAQKAVQDRVVELRAKARVK